MLELALLALVVPQAEVDAPQAKAAECDSVQRFLTEFAAATFEQDESNGSWVGIQGSLRRRVSAASRQAALDHFEADVRLVEDDEEAVAKELKAIDGFLPREDANEPVLILASDRRDLRRQTVFGYTGEVETFLRFDGAAGMALTIVPKPLSFQGRSFPGTVQVNTWQPEDRKPARMRAVSIAPFCRWALRNGGSVGLWEEDQRLVIRWSSSRAADAWPPSFAVPFTWTPAGGRIRVDLRRLSHGSSSWFEATVDYACPDGELLARQEYQGLGLAGLKRQRWQMYVPGDPIPFQDDTWESRFVAGEPWEWSPPDLTGWLVEDLRICAERGALHYSMRESGLPDLDTLKSMPVLDER